MPIGISSRIRRKSVSSESPAALRPLKALTEPLADVKKRARKLMAKLRRADIAGLTFELKEAPSAAGGGSLPMQNIPSAVVCVRSANMTPARLEAGLRRAPVPVIVRVDEKEILIDLRTVTEAEFVFIADGLKLVAAS